jgi:DHA1 family bicyclomycin/chloramphenicol resistance-like MFS transporter
MTSNVAIPETSGPKQSGEIRFVEFVLIMALCTSMVALSIDTMLPALGDISSAYGIEDVNQQQFIIGMLFVGLSVGQLFAGPISDTIGRKRALYFGVVIFVIGCFISYFSKSYELMLLGRFIQGLGASAPRIVSMAIVRDKYAGRDMAQVMSYIMGVFILVPAIAPGIGQGIIALTGEWRDIFVTFVLISLVMVAWFASRMNETLHAEDRRRFDLETIWRGLKTVCSNKQTFFCALASGFNFGGFMVYISTSQQIFQGYYDTGALFAFYFGVTAIAVGAAFFVNANIVHKYGMRFVIAKALMSVLIISSAFFVFDLFYEPQIPLSLFVIYMCLNAFCMGMIFGNFNALAMEPMGHLAGMASSVVGCLSLLIAVSVGMGIGQFYNDSLYPLVAGFVLTSAASLVLLRGIPKK